MRNYFYITTPIYYVNDKPHIGHAYTSVASDVMARYQRLRGLSCYLLTGTDEHGQKVAKSAKQAGETTKSFTERFANNFRTMADRFNITYNDFVRTSEKRHFLCAQAFWRRLEKRGDLYNKQYEGWYAVRDECYYDDSELVDGKGGRRVALSGAEVEWVKEPSIFFRLSKYRDSLLFYYDAHPDFVLPNTRMNEVRTFVENGLLDLCVSRTSFSWGVPVPERNGHIMYVWVEALTNYLTGLNFPNDTSSLFNYWPADLHIIGKDIVRFHAVYWPALLLSAGLELPRRVFAHGWWTNNGEKISKSIGNVIDPLKLIDNYGLDRVRYFMLREVPFGEDGNFSDSAIMRRSNDDLANGLGNLCLRVLTLVKRGWNGVLPSCGEFTSEDRALLKIFKDEEENFKKKMDICLFHRALEGIFGCLAEANRYITKEAPWALLSDGSNEDRQNKKTRAGTVLFILCDCLRMAAIDLQCFMPESMSRILDMLGVDNSDRHFIARGKRLHEGTELGDIQAIFPRLNKKEVPNN